MNLQFWLPFFLLIAISCVNDDIPTASYDCSNEQIVSYSAVVDDIVKTNCVKSGCHNGDLGTDKNWSVFKTFQEKNQLVRDRVTRPVGTAGHMPADGTLKYDEILSIVCWVEQGAMDN
jgi:hypothetical protein